MSLPSVKQTFFICLAIVMLYFAISIYDQVHLNTIACLLTLRERLVFLMLGLIFFTASVFNQTSLSKKIFSCLAFVIIVIGLTITIRHFFIQHLNQQFIYTPWQIPSFLQPFHSVIEFVQLSYIGSHACSKIHTLFLGLSLTTWTTILLIFLACICLWQQCRDLQKKLANFDE